jgi:hypothetical protein
MAVASYTCDGDIYTVMLIDDISKIESDMESVKDVISDTDPIEYKANMVESIRQGLAYEIYKNEDRVGFVYNKVDGYKYQGCSINITDTIAMLIALKTMFEIHDSHKISFNPHTTNIRDFKSMAYGPDIRVYYTTKEPLVLRRDMLEEKGLKLFKYLGIGVL